MHLYVYKICSDKYYKCCDVILRNWFQNHLVFILCFWVRFEVAVASFINFSSDDKSLVRRNGICQNIGKLPPLNYRKDFRINTIHKRFPFKVIFRSKLTFWSFLFTMYMYLVSFSQLFSFVKVWFSRLIFRTRVGGTNWYSKDTKWKQLVSFMRHHLHHQQQQHYVFSLRSDKTRHLSCRMSCGKKLKV